MRHPSLGGLKSPKLLSFFHGGKGRADIIEQLTNMPLQSCLGVASKCKPLLMLTEAGQNGKCCSCTCAYILSSPSAKPKRFCAPSIFNVEAQHAVTCFLAWVPTNQIAGSKVPSNSKPALADCKPWDQLCKHQEIKSKKDHWAYHQRA